jgi:hypothetical protein
MQNREVTAAMHIEIVLMKMYSINNSIPREENIAKRSRAVHNQRIAWGQNAASHESKSLAQALCLITAAARIEHLPHREEFSRCNNKLKSQYKHQEQII